MRYGFVCGSEFEIKEAAFLKRSSRKPLFNPLSIRAAGILIGKRNRRPSKAQVPFSKTTSETTAPAQTNTSAQKKKWGGRRHKKTKGEKTAELRSDLIALYVQQGQPESEAAKAAERVLISASRINRKSKMGPGET